MINLSTVPTFGYEYDTCNADQFRINSYGKLQLPNAKETAETSRIAANIFKVLEALVPPAGFVRIAMAICDDDLPGDAIAREILRGIAVVLGAGLLVLVTDILMTLAREVMKEVPAQPPVVVPSSA